MVPHNQRTNVSKITHIYLGANNTICAAKIKVYVYEICLRQWKMCKVTLLANNK
jgi:hypothetical protein